MNVGDIHTKNEFVGLELEVKYVEFSAEEEKEFRSCMSWCVFVLVMRESLRYERLRCRY